MADSNLPIVNALEELKADNAKQRKALQDSLGRRFRILSGEVQGLGTILANSFQVQSESAQFNSEILNRLANAADGQSEITREQLAFQQEQAQTAEFRDAENRAELRRLAQQRDQQPQKQNNQKDDEKKSKGIFGKLLSGIGGIIGGAGLGAGALLAGAGILAAGGGFFLKQLNELDGKAIKENVLELLSIKDAFGGMGSFFLEGGAFGLAMFGIGAGLASFGAGAAVGGAGNAIANFIDPNWAKSIVDNVVTLLSITDRVDFGSLGLLFKGAAFTLAMTGIGIGLGVFGLGAGIGGLGNALANFTDPQWAQSIVDNVTTLLSISELPTLGAFDFLATMTPIALGLAVFGIGSGIAGLTTALADFTTGGFAQSIVDNVATLLTIAELPTLSAVDFVATMGMIATGLAVFGVGSGIAGLGDALNRFTGGGDFAERIKKQVGTLLSITDNATGDTLTRAKNLTAVLGEISKGLLAFTGTKIVDSLTSIGTGLINFFTGNEAPMTQVLKFAENQEKLESASNSLRTITDALERMSGLDKIGIDFDIEDFSEELEDAVDNISDIDEASYALFAKRMQQLREAITPSELMTGAEFDMRQSITPPKLMTGAEVDVRSREVAAQVAQPNITVAAPQTQIQTDNSTRVNKTSVASASPRRDKKPWWAGRNYATN